MASLYDSLVSMVTLDEGNRLDVYLDSEGYPTVGRGHKVVPADNLKVGDVIDPAREDQLFQTDIQRSIAAAKSAIPNLGDRPVAFQATVANTLLQLGANAPTEKFPKAFAHLKNGDVREAITEFGLNEAGDGPSDWSVQTPDRFDLQMERLRDAAGPPESDVGLMGPLTTTEPEGFTPTLEAGPEPEIVQPQRFEQPLMRQEEPVHSQAPPAQVPESFWERRGDDAEMLVKALGSGLASTASLALRVVDGPLEITGGAADWMEEQSEAITASLPPWIQEELAQEIFTSTGDGGWEFNMPNLRQVANLAVQSVGPGGAIALGGKGLAKAGAKYLPKMFKEGARFGPAAAYGAANSGYIAADSYHNAYSSVYQELLAGGMDEVEAHNEAESAGRMAALGAGALSFVTGSVGGLAMTAGGVLRRVTVGAGLGSLTEAIEEPGQYVAEQLAAGKPVDPLEVAERAVLGAFAAGPMEGALAGLAGSQETARTAGNRMIDNILGDVPTSAEQAARDSLAPNELDLQLDYHSELDAARDALPESLPPVEPAPLPELATPEQETSTAGPTAEEPVGLNLPEVATEQVTEQAVDQVVEPNHAAEEVVATMRKNAREFSGQVDGKSMAPVASAMLEKQLEVRRRLTPEETAEIAEAHNIPLEAMGAMVTNSGFGWEAVMAHTEAKGSVMHEGAKAIRYDKVPLVPEGTYEGRVAPEEITEQVAEPVVDPVSDIELEVEKLKGPALRKELKDAGEKGYSKDNVLRLKAKVTALREAAAAEPVAEPTETTEPLGNKATLDLMEKFFDGDTTAPAPEPEPAAEPKLTKKEQKNLDKLQAKVDAAEAQAKLDAIEEDQGTPGLMVDEAEEFDPAAAMAAATAKTAETATTPTDAELDESLNAESRAEAETYKGASLKKALKERSLPVTGNVAAKRERLAMALKEEKMVAPPVLTDPNAAAVAAEQQAELAKAQAKVDAKLAKDQAKWDADTAKIEGLKGPQLRGILKKLKIPFTSKTRVPDLKKLLSKDRSPRPEAEPEIAPTEQVAPPSQPSTGVPLAAAATASEQPITPAVAPATRGHVRAGKPTLIPNDVIQKHWGNDWLKEAKVYRMAVGDLVYTVWRGTKLQEADGLTRTGPGKLGNYVAVLGEPKDFNPRLDQFNPIPTGTSRLRPSRDGKSGSSAEQFIEEHGNKELTRLRDEAILEGRKKEDPTALHDTHMAEAESIADDVMDGNPSREATIKAAMRVRELSHAVADNTKAYGHILDQWHRIRTHYDTKREPGEETGLSEAVAKVLAEREATIAVAVAEAQKIQDQVVRSEGLTERAARRKEREANTLPTEDDLNEFEKLVLAMERRRGVAWDTLRYLWRNWRGKQTKEDLDFEQSQGVDVIKDLKNMSIMDVIQRFRRGEVLRWTTAGIDQSLYLREVMGLLKKAMPEGGWSDDMNIRDLLDAVVPKTKNRMTDFGKNQLDDYVQRLKDEGVTHEDMTKFAGALHARWRNLHMVHRADAKAERDAAKAKKEELTALHDWEAKKLATVHVDPKTVDGQTKLREAALAQSAFKAAEARRMKADQVHRSLEPNETLSGISAEMIEDTLDTLNPDEQAKRLGIFKDHYFAMAKAQRAEYAEGELVPKAKLAEWDVELPANMSDLLTLPLPNDPKYKEKVAEGFHQTYVPLQHQKLDYNLRQVEANMRKPPTAEYNDVAGDEVRTAAGQASKGVETDMPAYIWERMQENLYTAYARKELNDVYRALAKMVRENPNALIWSNELQTQEELDLQVANPKYDQFGNEMDEQFMPDSELRGKDADVPGAKLRRSLGLSDLRSEEFLPLRYKDENGRQGIIRIHSAQFEAVFNGESGLGGRPTIVAGKISQWISKVNTAWSPGFLAAQIPKDFLSAKALLDPEISKHVLLRHYRQTFKAYWDVTKGNETPADASDMYKEMRRVIEEEYLPSGSHTTFFNKAKMSDHYRTLQEAIAEANNTGEGSRMPDAGTPLKLLKATGAMLDLSNTVVENIPRIMAFAGVMAEQKKLNGGKELTGQQRKVAIHRARLTARELNVNFATMGSRGAQINSWYPFYNATVSGNAILYRAFKNSPKFRKAVTAYAGFGLVNGIAQSILAGEDDDGRSRYWNLPKHIRDRNFVFFIPGVEQPLKVPLPYGLNAAVVMGDALAEAIMNPEADMVGAVTRSTASVMNTFNPIASSDAIRSALPAVGEPAYDLLRNKNFFGSPISPDKTGPGAGKITDAYNVTDPDRTTPFTAMAQALAWATGGKEFSTGGIDVSPGTLQYAWDFATGSAGATVRRTFEALTASSMTAAGVKAPMIRRYFGGVSDFHHKARYYDMREELAGIQNQRKLLYRNRRANPERYADHVAEYKDYYDRGVMRQFNGTEKRLRKLIGIKNKIRKQQGKTDRDRANMDKLNERIDTTIVSFNKYYYNRFIKGDM